MLKIIISFILCFTFFGTLLCQEKVNLDSLYQEAERSPNDTSKAIALIQISGQYWTSNPDSSIALLQLAEQFSEKQNWKKGIALAKGAMGAAYYYKSDFNSALKSTYEALELSEEINLKRNIRACINTLAAIYTDLQDFDKALGYYNTLVLDNNLSSIEKISIQNNMGSLYLDFDKTEKALEMFRICDDTLAIMKGKYPAFEAIVKTNIGRVYGKMGNFENSVIAHKEALAYFYKTNNFSNIALTLIHIGDEFFKINKLDSASYYFFQSLKHSQGLSTVSESSAYEGLYKIAKKRMNYEKALTYYEVYHQLNDSTYNAESLKKMGSIEMAYLKKKELALQKEEKKRIQAEIDKKEFQRNTLFVGSLLLLGFLIMAWFQKKQLSQSYRTLVLKNQALLDTGISQLTKIKTSAQLLTKKKYSDKLDELKKKEIAEKIIEILETEKAFVNPDFTLNKLADKIGINKSYVSQVINETFEKNYSVLINELRVMEAQRIMKSPSSKNFSIEGIGSTVGFKSKGTFNSYFKKITGVTPSFYIETVS